MVCIIPSGAVSGLPYSFNQQYCLPLIVEKRRLGQSTEGETSRKVDRQCCKIKPRLRPLAIRAQVADAHEDQVREVRAARRTDRRSSRCFAVHTRPRPPGDDARGLGDVSSEFGGGRSSLLLGRLKCQLISSSAGPFGFRRRESRSTARRPQLRAPVSRQAAPRHPPGPALRRPGQRPS
jgi:hypothetical protein